MPIPWETHGGEDVAVFAWGAGHGMFVGLYEQHELPHRMAWAACLGDGRTRCTPDATAAAAPFAAASTVFVLVLAAAAAMQTLS